ncbi:hypothetical protein V6V47_03315 [Micromonospora sp. CPCC 205539]|uniref:hypothetical protein n=1 Tax=Micromonospora sp. CPCC 205539 TaxID=3122408 RepID=UPI002FF33F8B
MGRAWQALWDRTKDPDPEVREEGVRGLARRRDRRAPALVRGLLAEDQVHAFTFEAAAYLADPSLLPLLNEFEPDGRGLAEALRECDPVRRAHRDDWAMRLLELVHLLRPDLDVAVLCERFELGLYLEVTVQPESEPGRWWVDGLLTRAGGDADVAAQLVVDDVARELTRRTADLTGTSQP